MKKNFMVAVLLSCMMILFSCFVNAQSNWLLNGNTNGAADYIGNNDNYHFPVYTNGYQRVIVSDSGYVGVGTYDGSNNPTLPRNKLLIQNGTIWDPYSYIEALGLTAQSIGLLSTSNRAAEGEGNAAVVGLAVNDANANFGIAGIASGDGSYNLAGFAFGSGNDEAENYGMQVSANGNGSDNYALVVRAGGDGSENIGVQVECNGVSDDNLGAKIYTTDATEQNLGLDLFVEGGAVENLGIKSAVSGATSTNTAFLASANGHAINVGVNSSASGDSSNTAVSGYAHGNSTGNYGVVGTSDSATNNVGVRGNAWGGAANKAMEAYATGGDGVTNWGIIAAASGHDNDNVGCYGLIQGGANSSAGSFSIAVDGYVEADSTSACIGVLGEVAHQAVSYSYGVMGTQAVSGSGTNSNIVDCNSPGPCPVDFAGYFEGDVFCSNTYFYSDPKLKENVREFKGGLDKLNKLNIKQYTFKNKEYPQLNMPRGEQVGVLSTEMKKVFPYLVKRAIHPDLKKHKDNIEFESVNYTALIPVLIQATQEVNKKTETLADEKKNLEKKLDEQERTIRALNDKIENLAKCVDELCARSSNSNSGSSDAQNQTQLFQSVPNPASSDVSIGYYIAKEFSSAYILLADISGNKLMDYSVDKTGYGSINLNTGRLITGTYKYSLVIDGKLFDTKSLNVMK